jgi:hypothetical protein
MARLFLLSLIVALGCMSCNQKNGTGSSSATDTTNFFQVTQPCAVLFIPAGDKLQMLKHDFGEKKFPELAEFNRATIAADSQLLADKGIKILRTSVPQLRFTKKNGEVVFINLNHSKYAWEIFLFNGYGDPIKAELTDVETAIQESGIH